MRSVFADFKDNMLYKKVYYIPLLLFAIIGYSFSLLNRTIGWDDLLREHYFGDISLSGRWGMTAWVKLLGLQSLDPFIDRFVALLFLLLASVLFSLLLFSVTKKNNVVLYTIVSSIYLTYPLINEIWEYCGANLFLAGGLALTTATLFLLRNNTRCLKYVLWGSLLLVLPMSSYESSIFYYLALICMVIFLDNVYNEEYHNLKKCVSGVLYYISPIIIAFIIRIVVSFIIRFIFDLQSVGGGATGINWLTDPPSLVIYKIAGGNFLKYFLGALVYFPITEFILALFIFIVFLVAFSIRKKSWTILIYGILLVISLYSQAILQGTALPYRTAQTLTLFMAFSVFLYGDMLASMNQRKFCTLYLVIMFGMCWYQAVYMNRVLCLNNLRSENEAYVVRSMGERLVRDYDRKPVVFVSPFTYSAWVENQITIGNDTWNEKLYNSVVNGIIPENYRKKISERFIETNVNCVTEQYAALQLLFSYYGFDIEVVGPIEKPHTPEYLNKDLRLLREATLIAKSESMSPYQIKDVGKYLIVTLSNDKYILDMLE